MGTVETGHAGAIRFIHGILDVGEALSPPVIREVAGTAPHADLVFFDAPPGTSCPVVETIRHCDRMILVTEPTPFGLHDLKLAVATMRVLRTPFAVVVNRADVGNDDVQVYCAEEGIDILAEIPDDRRIAETYSGGRLVCEALPEYQTVFAGLLAKVIDDERIGGH
jgi:MinD superfamily P-loop ATPase